MMPELDGFERPRLRYIEAFPVDVDGERKVLLRDPSGLTEATAIVPVPIFLLLTCCDGQHTLDEICAEFRDRFGAEVPRERLREMLEQLDGAYLLQTENFRRREQQLHDDFRTLPDRPAAHAGGAYSADPQELVRQFDSYWGRRGGPGAPPVPASERRRLRAIVAPHVDFHRGGHVYAWVYREVANAAPADLYVIFGTAHQPTRNRFALTTKDYATPLGPAVTDRELVHKIAERCTHQDVLADEFNHRYEHSVEFQAVALKHVWRDRPFRILPVLCGSFHDLVVSRTEPLETPEVREFVDVLGDVLAGENGSVCLVCGADFAHVGRKFGDEEGLDPGFLAGVESDDLAMLDGIVRADPRALFDSIAADQDRRRICGFPPMYAQFAVQPKSEGRLLRYDKTLDAQTQSVVTFAGIAYHEAGVADSRASDGGV